MKAFSRKAFTLIEVNIAILILSAGVIALISLFALGFRENRQSREDVGSAAYADAVISRIAMAVSHTNLNWSVFRKLGRYPSDKGGWTRYFDGKGWALHNCDDIAKDAYSSFMQDVQKANAGGEFPVNTAWPSEAAAGLYAGLVIIHEPDSAIVKVSFRAGRHPHELLSQPLYYTEVRFQGVVDE